MTVAANETAKSGDAAARKGSREVPRRVRPKAVPVLGTLLFLLYRPSFRTVRQFIRWLLQRLEGGPMFSVTLRRVFSTYHGVDVGMYTHGGWVIPYNLDRGTKVGRYSSIAVTAHTFRRNHPMNTRSTSALFFNPHFSGNQEDPVPNTPLVIGNDVWIGHNVIILPSVNTIGDGAVIGAGAVVHKDVPPFAVVTGHPCRVVRYRFSETVIQEILASRWWDKSLEELLPEFGAFTVPIEEDEVR